MDSTPTQRRQKDTGATWTNQHGKSAFDYPFRPRIEHLFAAVGQRGVKLLRWTGLDRADVLLTGKAATCAACAASKTAG